MLKSNLPNTQDEFLKYVLKNELNVKLFLVNGIKLEGKITHFDQYSVVLNNTAINGCPSILVYKHAISTVAPQGEVALGNIS